MELTLPFDNSYARLPERFFVKLPPARVGEPKLVKLNEGLADELGLDLAQLSSPQGLAMFAGNHVPRGAEPLAMAYAGHQFGNWVPQLGDGRAILLGEVRDCRGNRRDLQLKGSGRTPFSRMGDGRAALGPVLREYIVSEAMHALGIPTTRALAAAKTGERVIRETILPGAVLTRTARAHVRVGTFQFFAARQDIEALRALADYMIERSYPQAREAENPYVSLLNETVAAQARLIAQWMGVGFIHGVMNTDNMSIAGETIDYGPCAFMDVFHPLQVFSSIDEMGRYAFARQPDIGQWNLACLARAMLPILDDDEEKAIEFGQASIDRYSDLFAQAWSEIGRRKLGLTLEVDGDDELFARFLKLLTAAEADFTNSFRALIDEEAIRPILGKSADFAVWWTDYQDRLATEPTDADERILLMNAANPAFIARNHRVEQAIAAAYDNDFEPFERLVQVLAQPFTDQSANAEFKLPPEPNEVVRQTFCGT